MDRPFSSLGALLEALVITLFTTLAAATLTGCGGGSGGGNPGDEAGRSEGTPPVDAPTATPASRDGTVPHAPGGNTAMLVLDGETYFFALDGGGTCNPSALFGSAFRAILDRVDEDGNQIARVGGPGSQGIDIALGLGEDAGASILASLDIAWSSGFEPGTSVESYHVDGRRASGSAMFVSENGEGPVSGTFEVMCE